MSDSIERFGELNVDTRVCGATEMVALLVEETSRAN
jgi:hypothetical protein